MDNTIADKQYLAKILFTREKLDQKVVAKRVGVSERTMSKWVNELNWKTLRNRLLVGKEEILNNLYEQLEELNETITNKPKGERYADTKQADVQIKLTASIRNLETELAIADLVESGIRFVRYLQAHGDHNQVLEISTLWNEFLQSALKG
jgi:transposase